MSQAKRPTRAAKARKAHWKPPALLETPAPPPGYKYRWLRTSIRGEDDDRNMMLRNREGYEPVRPEEMPESFRATMPTLDHGKLSGVVGIGSVILAKVPEEIADSRQEYFADITRRTEESIENDLMAADHPAMPISRKARSQVEFRRRKVDFDESDDGTGEV